MFGSISYVLTVFIIDYIQQSDAACTPNSGGVYTFGPNCEYMCHCKSSGACDSSTGYCSNGCDTEWFGPGCQFRDLAEKATPRQLDNIPEKLFASRANDGNEETCSYTDDASASRPISPWWRVQFPQSETIQNMIIVTKGEYLHYFKGFKVTIEKAPAYQATVTEYYPPASDVQLCYQHSNVAPTNKTMHVTCYTPLEGNLVRIQLERTDMQLVLCDVRINGGRNMAFGKNLTFSSAYNENRYPHTNAVDGVLTHSRWEDCFAINHHAGQALDWFTVNLGHLTFIKHIIITRYSNARIKNYQLYTSNTTGLLDAVKVHDDTGTYPPKISLQGVGQFVTLRRSSGSPTVVCEMEIYGDCTAGKCGYDCSNDCHCKAIEDRISGVCTSGCEGRWTGPGLECINDCGEFQWGETCSNQCGQCNNSHACDVVTGYCPFGCQHGYIDTPLCDIECPDGTYGENCTKNCSGFCYGGDVCRKSEGYCERGCSPGYTGNKCEEKCTSGWYGINCTLKCSTNCEGGSPNCHHVNGTCILGCNSGFEGHMCDKECDSDFWDKKCKKRCGSCLSGSCNKTDGVCDGGCSAGYKTTQKCVEKCDDLTFGINCDSTCNSNCVDVCDKADGTCSNCKSGWKGHLCSQSCDDNEWGENCKTVCGLCLNGTCDRFNGQCIGGCQPGYKTTSMCTEECSAGTYGADCLNNCSANCKTPWMCNNVNGHCEGCIAGKQGDKCERALPQDSTGFPAGGAVGGVVAAVVVIVAVVLVFLFWRRRKIQSKNKSNSQIGFDSVLSQELEADDGSLKRNIVYENSSVILADFGKSKVSQDLSYVKKEEATTFVEETNDIYYNEGPLSQRLSEHSVFVADLKYYVKKKSTEVEYFTKEFEKLPSGLQYPTKDARSHGNVGKNRYKAMYAYDHSRVILKTLPGKPHSDYINAAFIRGHFKDNSYIAAQGPIDFTIDDFWRMIWEKDVNTIVMATRLVEETKVKCIQYWAEVDESVEYGSVAILTESVDVFAEFTIRHLKVSHQDNPDNVRNITQFHYTAWPDKDVPRSTSSLLHFWYQVRKNEEEKKHPWLVHCSAGVGRTGTFIALDILYDQGTDQGCVDVFGCVKGLRDQRVSMVQTKEQYRYLHNILVEALVLPSKPVHIDEIPAVYNELQQLDPNTGKTELLLQYETLLDETNSGSESEDIDEMYSSAKKADNRNKNRYDNILAANPYRPCLFTEVKGCTDYINAVYIPSYCDTHGYIITQTPLKNTVIDCCRLVCEQEVSVIVTFEENSDEEEGVYLPESGSIKHGPFTITLVSKQDKGNYILKIHKIHFDSKEHTFTQLICKQWSPGQVTPDDPYKILSFLQDLERIQRQNENNPVVVQCLNGAERSGLIVVLMNIMERVRFDGEVSIPQVIRQLQIRRQQIIPNFDQFKFCYCVLKAHAESNATYANV